MDVRAENRGRPHQKVRFPGHPGVRVRNVRGKFGPKSLCLCGFFFPDCKVRKILGGFEVFLGVSKKTKEKKDRACVVGES